MNQGGAMSAQIRSIEREFSFLRPDQIILNDLELQRISRSTLPDQQTPQVIIYPESSEEIQQILEVANRLKIPVWYVSTGKNWGYGCKSAPYAGGITLVLERMKKISEVNSELGYAVIEPGVTYADLNEYLTKNRIPLWTDSAGTTKSASIIGNALDKGRGLTPYADHFGMLCGMDVILPDGTYLETSPRGNFKCKHTYKWSLGPYVEGLFGQSNLGIVVKAGIWLMPEPEAFDFFAFEYTATKNEFPRFIDDFRKLFFTQGLISRPHLANDFAMLCIVDQYPLKSLTSGRKNLSREQLEQWKRKHGIRDWTFGGGLYGTKKQIRAQKNLIRRYLAPYGTLRYIGAGSRDTIWGGIFRKLVVLGARLEGKSKEFISQIFPAIHLFRGRPTDDFAKQVYFKSKQERPLGDFNPATDNCGFIWIGPLVPFTREHIGKVLELADPIFEEYQFDVFVELIVESPRTVIALFGVFYDPAVAEETARARSWYKALRQKMLEEGYSAYRETSTSTPLALDGNIALKEFLSEIKTAVDKNNILAPGRYGVSTAHEKEN